MMNKVIMFEPVKSAIDTTSAKDFGEVVTLFKKDERRCSVFSTDRFQEAVISKLTQLKFDPDRDYICVVGTMITVAVGLIAIARECPCFKILLYSSTESRYVERIIGEREL